MPELEDELEHEILRPPTALQPLVSVLRTQRLPEVIFCFMGQQAQNLGHPVLNPATIAQAVQENLQKEKRIVLQHIFQLQHF